MKPHNSVLYINDSFRQTNTIQKDINSISIESEIQIPSNTDIFSRFSSVYNALQKTREISSVNMPSWSMDNTILRYHESALEVNQTEKFRNTTFGSSKDDRTYLFTSILSFCLSCALAGVTYANFWDTNFTITAESKDQVEKLTVGDAVYPTLNKRMEWFVPQFGYFSHTGNGILGARILTRDELNVFVENFEYTDYRFWLNGVYDYASDVHGAVTKFLKKTFPSKSDHIPVFDIIVHRKNSVLFAQLGQEIRDLIENSQEDLSKAKLACPLVALIEHKETPAQYVQDVIEWVMNCMLAKENLSPLEFTSSVPLVDSVLGVFFSYYAVLIEERKILAEKASLGELSAEEITKEKLMQFYHEDVSDIVSHVLSNPDLIKHPYFLLACVGVGKNGNTAPPESFLRRKMAAFSFFSFKDTRVEFQFNPSSNSDIIWWNISGQSERSSSTILLSQKDIRAITTLLLKRLKENASATDGKIPDIAKLTHPILITALNKRLLALKSK